MKASIKVLIAEDDPIVRRGLAALIRREESMTLVGIAADAHEAIAIASEIHPDVAILDVVMPGGGGERAAREICRHSPLTKALAFSVFRDRAAIMGMLEAGAVGYIVKGGPSEEIIESIMTIAGGRSALSSGVFAEVVDELIEHRSEERRRQKVRQSQLKRIRGALEDAGVHQIVLQPICSLETLEVVGVEALSRFKGPLHRSPQLWFAEAEEVGLRQALELAAIEKAFTWLDVLPPSMYLSVNASPTTATSEEFARLIAGGSAKRILVEITEHAPISDYVQLNARLDRIRDLGVRIAIDDAGAGFASLRHILLIHPEVIKLDITLIAGIVNDPGSQALASGLISFADRIGATIVAEGVENAEQRSVLRSLGVRYGQGFHLGMPTSDINTVIDPGTGQGGFTDNRA